MNGYAEEMPYENDRFDLVIIEDIREHVADPEKVMRECFRVLVPGGITIVKFPSFRMMFAHHLERALNLPALHYILLMKKWASCLNYLRLQPEYGLAYEPFDEAAMTKYGRSVTCNLNGMDFSNYQDIVNKTSFDVRTLTCVQYETSTSKGRHLAERTYNMLLQAKVATEFLSSFVLFIGKVKDKKHQPKTD